jgi:hypothetical protein
MRTRLPLVILLAAAALGIGAPCPASAQDASYFETMYGPVRDVTLNDLGFDPQGYDGRAIRIRARLEVEGIGSNGRYALSELGVRVAVAPIQPGGGELELQEHSGKVIEMTGVFVASSSRSMTSGDLPTYDAMQRYVGVLRYWSWLGPPEKNSRVKAVLASLEQLVTKPGALDGQLIRVVGRFRGRNLFGDLPAKSMRVSSDWVIKDSLFAAWITGRKPKGDGFDLDPGIRRDTARWIEIIGRPRTSRAGVVSIEAVEVALAAPPAPQRAEVAPAPPPPERPKVPPVIVFSLPLEGEADFDPSGRIVVQFSNDMEEDSFKGRVGLRYVGPARPGDSGFEGMRVTYNPGMKALVIDPGGPLRPGRAVEVILMKGIVDVDGQPLARRDGRAALEDVVETLRFSGA